MCYPGLRVIIELPSIVDRAQVSERVSLLDYLEKAVPGCWLLLHKIPLIGQRPPDIAIRCQPCNYIAQVTFVALGIHMRKAPAIVRVKENKIGFNTQTLKIADTLFEMAEEGRIEAGEIPARVPFLAQERVAWRLILVIGIVLRKHTHAHFIERCVRECAQRHLLQGLALVCPGVAGGADREKRRSIGVAEMKCFRHAHRAVIAGTGGQGDETTCLSIHLSSVAAGDIVPRARFIWHKP